MPLPAPELDGRKFQDIVDDVKRQIALRCPEWTDHNVSDPGVTVLELFAYLFESTLFRLNQVPERNYVKFLELIGVEIEMPHPATAEVRFELTKPIEDLDSEASREHTYVARKTVATTARTELTEPLEFSLDVDLKLVRPKLAKVLAVPQMNDQAEDANAVVGGSVFDFTRPIPRKRLDEEQLVRLGELDEAILPGGFTIFGNPEGKPEEGDCLLIGFEGDIPRNFLELEVVQRFSGTGLAPDYPSQKWEYWDGAGWKDLRIDADDTRGFDYDGTVRFIAPFDMQRRLMGADRLFWVRVRYTVADLEPKVVTRIDPQTRLPRTETLRPYVYERSPQLLGLKARTLGGQAPASNCIIVENEVLGRSDGKPGQAFQLLNERILNLEEGEVVWIGVVKDDPYDYAGWAEWTCVKDFSESDENDRHFVLDAIQGLILFGPSIPQPDSSPPQQYGAIPPFGHSVVMSRYRLGGGPEGNVGEDKIVFTKTEVPHVARVSNPQPATGGRAQESMERARLRALEILKVRNRAVTVEDYETLARKASSSVGRAKCIQPLRFDGRVEDPNLPDAGKVQVLVIPALSRGIEVPSPDDLRPSGRLIEQTRLFLDERRLLTAQLEVKSPEYVFVSVHLKLLADPRLDFGRVRETVASALNSFIHPLYGWFDGLGWPFGRGLSLADIYARIQQLPDGLIPSDARIMKSVLVGARTERKVGAESLATPQDMNLRPYEVLCSRQHVIEILPLTNLKLDLTEVRF